MKNIINFIKKYNITPNKSLGQNFLLDSTILEKMVSALGDLNNFLILEIGPGLGFLTKILLEKKIQEIIVIEKDQRFLSILKNISLLYPETYLNIILGDALLINLQEFKKPTTKIKIISNLPYNISVRLLIKWMKDLKNINKLVLTFQKDVALRLVAKPKTKEYGRLSILSQLLFDIEILFDIDPKFFLPRPKVVSTVVSLKPRDIDKDLVLLIPFLEEITHLTFSHRRKILKVPIKKTFSKLIEANEDYFMGIFRMRAEELTLEDFIKLSKLLFELKDKKYN